MREHNLLLAILFVASTYSSHAISNSWQIVEGKLDPSGSYVVKCDEGTGWVKCSGEKPIVKIEFGRKQFVFPGYPNYYAGYPNYTWNIPVGLPINANDPPPCGPGFSFVSCNQKPTGWIITGGYRLDYRISAIVSDIDAGRYSLSKEDCYSYNASTDKCTLRFYKDMQVSELVSKSDLLNRIINHKRGEGFCSTWSSILLVPMMGEKCNNVSWMSSPKYALFTGNVLNAKGFKAMVGAPIKGTELYAPKEQEDHALKDGTIFMMDMNEGYHSYTIEYELEIID